MASTWSPDTCSPAYAPCILETTPDGKVLISITRLCSHHTTMRALLLSDAVLFARIVSTQQVKNFAGEEVANELGIEQGDVTWRVDVDDRIVFTTGLNAQRRATLQTAINLRVGAGLVIVE